ncbi:hypothetical protein CMU19_04530 [Elizabethkingia anophelis]|nr:hypothetical protein [Elizabethkingia anophelis]
MQDNIEFDQLLAEELEARLLVNEGFYFETSKKRFLGFGKNYIKWHIKPLTYGTIIHANVHAVKIKMSINDDNVSSVISEMDDNIIPQIDFIATCLLHSKWKIKLFRKILSRYLLWKLSPEKALKICVGIIRMYDLRNFMNSIRLIGTITSPQEPNLVDGNSQGSDQPTEQ